MKRDWSDGYVADITYSHGYFHELAPNYLRFHLLVNGLALPSDGGNYTYCELGYGQGVSANLHAAANPRGEFWGTDFNSEHALNARALAQQAGVNAHWLDQSFEALLDHATPHFDYIVLHGVWSWVSPAAQHALVEFMRRKLKPGGIVFMSYNVLPGWNNEKPLRDLLWLHTEHASAPDMPTPAKIAAALQYANTLRRHGCAFFTNDARAGQALDDMLRQEPGSLAHEYFNRTWCLSHFAEVERQLQAANLGFAASIHMSDITGEVRDKLAAAGIATASIGAPMRETTADFVLNRRFRRDIFMRGALRLSSVQRAAALDETKFALARGLDAVPLFVNTPYGRIAMEEARVKPMLEMLNAASGAVALRQLREIPELADWPVENLVQTLASLVGRRDLCPVFADDAARAQEARTFQLNAAIASRAFEDNALRYFASPVAGAGIDANRYERLFWLAWHKGERTVPELGRSLADMYGAEGEAAHEFETQAGHFVSVTLPVWRRLGVIDTRGPKVRLEGKPNGRR